MTETDARLTHCFANVFPGLPPAEIRNANMASLAAWDSIAHISLLSAVGEEFGFELQIEDFDELVSYALISAYLKSKTP